MANSTRRKITGTALISVGTLATVAILFHIIGFAAQGTSVPDHSSFTDCQACHSGVYKMWTETSHGKAADSSVSCITCHKPGSSDFPKQLVRDPEKLCGECHTQRAVLEGKGARGVEDTRSFHSGVKCVSCHMSESNHNLKLFRPDDPAIPEDRLDTCTRCHSDNNRKMRAKQIQDWFDFYKEAMDPIEADMAVISAAMKEKPDLLSADLKTKLDTINLNLSIIVNDRSRGAHNLDFALEIMSRVAKDVKEIKAAIK